MKCRNCPDKDPWSVTTRFDEGRFIDTCNFCGSSGGPSLAFSDVYFPGPHSCENITDSSGKPIHFATKSEKARVMREQGISEVGDRVGGARYLPKPTGKSWYQIRREAGKLR